MVFFNKKLMKASTFQSLFENNFLENIFFYVNFIPIKFFSHVSKMFLVLNIILLEALFQNSLSQNFFSDI